MKKVFMLGLALCLFCVACKSQSDPWGPDYPSSVSFPYEGDCVGCQKAVQKDATSIGIGKTERKCTTCSRVWNR